MQTPSDAGKTAALLESSMKTWFRKMQATGDPSIAAGLQVLANAPTLEESSKLLYGFFDRQAKQAVKDSEELIGKLWPLLAYYALDLIDWDSLTRWVLEEHRDYEYSGAMNEMVAAH